jgi:hypothetical protein
MITKGLALHISLAQVCEPGGARVGSRLLITDSRGSCPAKVLDFRAKPEYGTLAAYLRRAIWNL